MFWVYLWCVSSYFLLRNTSKITLQAKRKGTINREESSTGSGNMLRQKSELEKKRKTCFHRRRHRSFFFRGSAWLRGSAEREGRRLGQRRGPDSKRTRCRVKNGSVGGPRLLRYGGIGVQFQKRSSVRRKKEESPIEQRERTVVVEGKLIKIEEVGKFSKK